MGQYVQTHAHQEALHKDVQPPPLSSSSLWGHYSPYCQPESRRQEGRGEGRTLQGHGLDVFPFLFFFEEKKMGVAGGNLMNGHLSQFSISGLKKSFFIIIIFILLRPLIP